MKSALLIFACVLASAALSYCCKLATSAAISLLTSAAAQDPACSAGGDCGAWEDDSLSLLQAQPKLVDQAARNAIQAAQDDVSVGNAPWGDAPEVVALDNQSLLADDYAEAEDELDMYGEFIQNGNVTIKVGNDDFVVPANEQATIDMLKTASKTDLSLLQLAAGVCPAVYGPHTSPQWSGVICGPREKRTHVGVFTTLHGCYAMTQVFHSPRAVSSYYYWRANPAQGHSSNGDAFGWCRGCDYGANFYYSNNPWSVYSCGR